MMMLLVDFLSRLEAQPRTEHKTFVRARVPGSGSKDYNLAVWEKGGWIWFKDFTGKQSKEDILGSLGLQISDLRTTGEPQTYTYSDGAGRPRFRKKISRRREDPWAKKDCFQEGIDGERGLDHLADDERNVLYNLKDVQWAIQHGKRIFICEGEAACERIKAEWREIATCQRAGADARGDKWLACYTEQLAGAAEIIIVADRDEVGEAYAADVYRKLKDRCPNVRIVSSAVVEDKSDAEDHILAGFGPDEFTVRPELVPKPATLSTQGFGDIFKPVELNFLLEPYLPRGKCIFLDADGGVGKTTLMAAWAGAFSAGFLPITGEQIDPVKTLYLHKGEDQSEEIETVARANLAQPNMIQYYKGRLILNDAGIELVGNTVVDGGFQFVVFDALFYFLQGLMEDTNTALDAMAVMEGLNNMAAKTGASVVLIRHTTKGSLGKAASELGMGSAQFRNSARGQLVARYHPDRKQYPGVVVVTDEKASLLVGRGDAFAYRRVGLEVQYLQDFQNPFTEEMPEIGGKLEEAQAIIQAMCGNCLRPESEVRDAVLAAGIGERTYKRARKAMTNLESRRGGDTWYLFAKVAPEIQGYNPYTDQ